MGLFDRFRKGGMSEKHIQQMIDSGVTDDMTEEQSVQVMQADLNSKIRQLQQVREENARLDEENARLDEANAKADAYQKSVVNEFYLYHPQDPADKILPDGAPVAVRYCADGDTSFDSRDRVTQFDWLKPVGDGYYYDEGVRAVKDFIGLTEEEKKYGQPMHHFRREPNILQSHGRADFCYLYREKDVEFYKNRMKAPDYMLQLPPKEFKESRLDALAMRTEKYMRIESAVMVDTQYREKPVLKYQYDYYPESRRQEIYNWINEQMYRCDVVKNEQGLVEAYTARVDYAKMLAFLKMDEFKNVEIPKMVAARQVIGKLSEWEEGLLNQKKAELLFETIQWQGGMTKFDAAFLKDNEIVRDGSEAEGRPHFYHQEVAEKYAQLRKQGIEFPQLQ